MKRLLIRVRRAGKAEIEGGTGVQFALHPDAPPMLENNVLRDGEPESGAEIAVAGAGLVHAIEAFEKSWQMFGGDSLPIITDIEDTLACVVIRSQRDAAR